MNETCYFKNQLVYLKGDRLDRIFTVISNSTSCGVTWCEDPTSGIAVALDTHTLELAPRLPDPDMERMLAAARDEERRATYALGCWFLIAGGAVAVAIIYYLLK